MSRIGALFIIASVALAQAREVSRSELDLEYARVGDRPLLLDLHRPPEADKPLPVVVWIHGGGWRAGSKDRCPARFLVEHGFAVASVNYRLTQQAIFPAQIHDCKAAIRWLRANAKRYGLDPKRIGAWGSSAGGHLAALLGTSGGVAELEGELGNPDHSSRVQAVVDFCGPADFLAWKVKRSPEWALFGGTIEEKKKLARSASPVAHASADDPPFFIVHGRKDRTVPVRQAELLDAALRKAKGNSTLLILDELGHGLMNPDTQGLALLFFEMHLLKK
jgi:acetyl esterase/lipase